MSLKAIAILFCITLTVANSQAQILFSGEFEADGFFTTFEGSWLNKKY